MCCARRLRRARALAYNYVVVVGNQEVEAATINVKRRDSDSDAGDDVGTIDTQGFISMMRGEIEQALEEVKPPHEKKCEKRKEKN